LAAVPLANSATIGNMSPEYGSTCAIFRSPGDPALPGVLRPAGRAIELVESYAKEQGLWAPVMAEPRYSERLELDLSTIEPSIAGPKRPQDRVARAAGEARLPYGAGRPGGPGAEPSSVQTKTDEESAESFPASDAPAAMSGATGEGRPEPDAGADLGGDGRRVTNPTPATLPDGTQVEIDHGHVVVAAITSCTNTSNPHVMMAAGLLAQKAVARGLTSKPWVKTSLAPGSKVVMDYYEAAGLVEPLATLRFNLVGYGCTTCIGNSGPPGSTGVRGGQRRRTSVGCSVFPATTATSRAASSRTADDLPRSPPLVVATRWPLARRNLFEDPHGTVAASAVSTCGTSGRATPRFRRGHQAGLVRVVDDSASLRRCLPRRPDVAVAHLRPPGDAFDWQPAST
jgi:aconitate hydratase